MENGTKIHGRNLFKNIDAKFDASDYYDKNLNKYKVKTGASLRFWENKGWINEIDPFVGFSGILGTVMEKRQINRWKKNCQDGGKLVKMIRDDYSISPEIRQILLHWHYELTEKDFFNELSNERVKIIYYWFNRQEILQKA